MDDEEEGGQTTHLVEEGKGSEEDVVGPVKCDG